MAFRVADFEGLPWQAGAHPLEKKKVCAPGLTLLEFAPGFADPNWCGRSHVLFVLAGALNVEFRDRTLELRAGNSIQIDSGTEHRVSVSGVATLRLFVISDAEVWAA
jgi:quercetin dioxygenase-like cupin family protein